MITTISPKIKRFLKRNQKLDNRTLYIEYLLDMCETEQEKKVIEKILNNSIQNNSLIRLRNFLIKEGEIAPYSKDRNKKYREVREQFSPINGLISGFRRYFNF